jgi:type I site-specific restriction endonuclease
MLFDLNLPKYDFKLKLIEGSKYIFDEVRKKYIKLTPEEWVRQNLIQYLCHQKNYPLSLMVVEYALKYNGLNKRADILCFDKEGKPLLIVECKASSVKISQKVFEQIARYNFDLKVPLLMVSNGLEHYCCRMNYEKHAFDFLKEIPEFQQKD